MKHTPTLLLLAHVLPSRISVLRSGRAQDTAFTYKDRLAENGGPAIGRCDL